MLNELRQTSGEKILTCSQAIVPLRTMNCADCFLFSPGRQQRTIVGLVEAQGLEVAPKALFKRCLASSRVETVIMAFMFPPYFPSTRAWLANYVARESRMADF